MHPVAKRCLTWAVVLVVVGALVSSYGPEIIHRWHGLVGGGAEPALHVFGFVMNLLRGFALPLAAGLVTATIIIQTLAPRITMTDEQ